MCLPSRYQHDHGETGPVVLQGSRSLGLPSWPSEWTSPGSQRIQTYQFQQTRLSREIWTQEMEMARLRSPQVIRAQAVRLGLEVGPKEPEGVRRAGR